MLRRVAQGWSEVTNAEPDARASRPDDIFPSQRERAPTTCGPRRRFVRRCSATENPSELSDGSGAEELMVCMTLRWRETDSNVRSRIDPLSGIRIGFRGER